LIDGLCIWCYFEVKAEERIKRVLEEVDSDA